MELKQPVSLQHVGGVLFSGLAGRRMISSIKCLLCTTDTKKLHGTDRRRSRELTHYMGGKSGLWPHTPNIPACVRRLTRLSRRGKCADGS